MKNKYGLTKNQFKFCTLMIADETKNATRAYQAAFPNCKTEGAAAAGASRLMKVDSVIKYLDDHYEKSHKKAAEKLEITVDRILEEEACIAFLDPGDFFDEDGHLRQVQDMPENARRALASLKINKKDLVGGGEDKDLTWLDVVHELRYLDKGKALDRLEKIFGMQRESVVGGINVTINQILADIDGKDRGKLPMEME